MRIETVARLAAGLALVALSACPGKLANKAEFDAWYEAHADAGAPGSEAGSANMAGTAAQAGSTATDACGDVPARLFVPSCGGTGCHNATAPQQGLDLVSPDVASRVVGVTGKQCLQLLADPQNPEQSLMYLKLFPKPPCGAPMPLARPALSSADIACIKAWIAAQ
jgi:hypothetical protein